VADTGDTGKTPVSADRANQREWGRTEGCPELLTARWNSPRQRARRGFDGDRRTGVRLGTGVWLIGGVRGPARSHSNGRSTADRVVSWDSERKNTRADEFGADRPGPPGSVRERGRESARAGTRAVVGWWGPPVRRRGRARGLAGPSRADWAKLAFSFSLEFLMAFLFYFP
jgi:hypothetical protein